MWVSKPGPKNEVKGDILLTFDLGKKTNIRKETDFAEQSFSHFNHLV